MKSINGLVVKDNMSFLGEKKIIGHGSIWLDREVCVTGLDMEEMGEDRNWFIQCLLSLDFVYFLI